MQEKEVQLYGGAITSSFPATMVDVSDMRQVPDTQEVYTEVETGMCIIIELLAREHEVSNDNCGNYFFIDLAKANGCNTEGYNLKPQHQLHPTDYPLVSQPPSGSVAASGRYCTFGCVISGHQHISKYTNEKGKENDILVVMSVLRFEPPISTDVLISISAPQWIHPESSEARVVQKLRSEEEVTAVMRRILLSFNIRDWGLFVPEE
ncbi:Ran-binding protein, putative [Trypanosoma equiperdum]|uniref:Ran-binding protein, putative n=4 Tax=Trypanozoon TaxID=39700 RepID=Q57YX6_TRYB2|nr:RNA-binding protein, putative [Trypanosoma brucei gambiense DAL972]XP_847168.1 Ran-binding protein, putative [Trypanosoma brucei brucei TREU927]AAX79656.1 Ran-binding protein, putative [Trypanosoma brucei]RHW71090.1 Ran-binding protein [Trypanosoma brucei equiperdum]SCU66139.1 Ran-binding protein, putative [Trypanosoma equiperdum]AAZ13102.1 Ran-binding protein, putative [Trypanosoma brucei brucei TREU927]CBH13365.1 RNA-binding protein, putative [Trypanosoma brucei gambiense DAL972]|eukprot:XP_011775642.1 RNA-binding protein, putative [Trypanosoma brucei gambiense DAL972]